MKSAEAGASGEIYCKLNLGASQAERGEPGGPMPPALTGHGQCDGLARLVVPVLVIHRLHVVTPCVRGHRGEDDEGVLQRDGSAGTSGRRETRRWTQWGH